MAQKNPFDADIVINILQNSSLPTILVEGKDDMIIYRWVESRIGIGKVDFLACGGRNTLLKVFERRSEISNIELMFIADQDMWVFVGIPIKYQDIFFTKGYSIENDLYLDGKDRIAELLDKEENIKKLILFRNLVKWFAFESENYLRNPNNELYFDISLLSNKIIPKDKTSFTKSFLASRDYQKPTKEYLLQIAKEFELKIRGKFLFQIFEKIFQENRKSKTQVTYTKEQLFDMCFREGCKDETAETCVNRIIQAIKQYFNL